jgi:DNA-binding winged helix-turn-helix (wHTH) protein
MLELLSLRKGTTLTKEMFLNHLYGGMDEPEMKIIDVFICKLRKKLANASNGKNYIETVWGRGYVLRRPTEEEVKISALTLWINATQAPVPAAMIALCTALRCDLKPRHSRAWGALF